MEPVAHSSAQSEHGDMQAECTAGCASEHAVMSGFSGIHTQRVHLEKPEMLSVSGVKDVLYDECDPAEECFSVCTAHVQRRKHGRVKIHTVHHCFPPQITPSITTALQNFCGHPDFTFTLLPPPPLLFAFAPVLWHVASSQLVLAQRFHLYSTVSPTCHKSVLWRKTVLFSFRPSFDHIKHNCYCHL